MSFEPYTTPTPLPKRPDWSNEDWVNYFKTNHPNFWFKEQLLKNYTLEKGHVELEEPKLGKLSNSDFAIIFDILLWSNGKGVATFTVVKAAGYNISKQKRS